MPEVRPLSSEQLDFIRALILGEVNFTVIDIHALALHGYSTGVELSPYLSPESYQGLFVAVEPSQDNRERAIEVLCRLHETGAAEPDTPEDLTIYPSQGYASTFYLGQKEVDEFDFDLGQEEGDEPDRPVVNVSFAGSGSWSYAANPPDPSGVVVDGTVVPVPPLDTVAQNLHEVAKLQYRQPIYHEKIREAIARITAASEPEPSPLPLGHSTARPGLRRPARGSGPSRVTHPSPAR
jgi:hypothetical protein